MKVPYKNMECKICGSAFVQCTKAERNKSICKVCLEEKDVDENEEEWSYY